MINDIRQHINEALETVEHIPDEYRKIAFEVILHHLLSRESVHKNIKVKKMPMKLDSMDSILESDFDWSSTNIPLLKPVFQCLYILKIAKEKFKVDGLSPNEIQVILSQKFRISKTPNAVSMLLMNEVGKHIDRIQIGKRFHYKITQNGIDRLSSEIKRIKIQNE